jgi:hypothetical protein
MFLTGCGPWMSTIQISFTVGSASSRAMTA